MERQQQPSGPKWNDGFLPGCPIQRRLEQYQGPCYSAPISLGGVDAKTVISPTTAIQALTMKTCSVFSAKELRGLMCLIEKGSVYLEPVHSPGSSHLHRFSGCLIGMTLFPRGRGIVDKNHTLKFLVCILFYFYTTACQGRCMGVHTAVNRRASTA